MPKTLTGVLPIAHTPFLDNGEIDQASLARQIDWAYECGADGFGTGMVSELLRLTTQERIELTQKLVELNDGRGAMFMSVGAESTKQALQYARAAQQAGCDAVMAIPPVSTALPPSAVVDYYRALADGVDLPLIVQDASAYVGREIPIDACVALLDSYGPDKILFKPEAAPTGPRISQLRDATSGRARIFEGSGGILLIDSFRRGVAGTMPGMEVLDGIVALWRALHEGDEERAYRIHAPISSLVALQMQAGLDGFLAVEKHLLVKRGIFAAAHRRPPFSWSLDPETTAEVERLLARLEASLAG